MQEGATVLDKVNELDLDRKLLQVLGRWSLPSINPRSAEAMSPTESNFCCVDRGMVAGSNSEEIANASFSVRCFSVCSLPCQMTVFRSYRKRADEQIRVSRSDDRRVGGGLQRLHPQHICAQHLVHVLQLRYRRR